MAHQVDIEHNIPLCQTENNPVFVRLSTNRCQSIDHFTLVNAQYVTASGDYFLRLLASRACHCVSNGPQTWNHRIHFVVAA